MTAVRDYFRVLLPLLAAFGVYSWFVAPLIDPPVQQRRVVWDGPYLTAADHWWKELFPEGDWRAQQPRVLQTESGVLLFQEWQQLSDDRWRLTPLSMLLIQNGNSQQTDGSPPKVLLVDAPRGAEIQFKQAIDWTTGRPPPVSGGQLLGQIRIFSPEKLADGSESLLIETSDLRIDRRHIWTNQEVRLQSGESIIQGRSLEIFMDRDLLSPSELAGSGDSPFDGFDYLELIYVDRVRFRLADGGLWGESSQTSAKGGTTSADHAISQPAYLDVDCQGSFRFDFHTSIATLNDGVEMTHRVRNQPEDRFASQTMKLHIDWTDSDGNLRKFSAGRVDRIEAEGRNSDDKTDISRLIRVEAPGIQARGQGRWLEVDLKRGQMAISNRLPGTTEPESDPAYLEKDQFQAWSPDIRIQRDDLVLVATNRAMSANSQDVGRPMQSPAIQRLGKIYAAGPGQARLRTQDGDQWKLVWSNHLTLQPDGDDDRLTMDGAAYATSDRHGRFSAEYFDLWFIPPQADVDESTNPTAAAPSYGKARPSRMRARGDVIVRSPMLRAQIGDLHAWFVYPAPPPSSPIPGGNPAMTQPLARQPKPSPETGPGQLAGTTSPFVSAPMRFADVQETPISVTGNTLKTRILVVNESPTIDDLVIDGNVTVTRERISSQRPMPLTITGTMVLMNTVNQGKSNISVAGEPAKIQIGTGWLEGKEIRFNEQDQMVWMDQPGLIVLPPEAMATASPAIQMSSAPPGFPTASSNMEWIEPMRVEWAGQLIFDGLVAKMLGGVKMRGRLRTAEDTLWHISGESEELELHFAKRIVMGSDSPIEGELSKLVLNERVDVRGAQTDLQGNRRSLEHLSLPRIEFHLQEQTLVGQGPGWLRSRRIGTAATPMLHQKGPNEAATSAHQLQCLHLVYVGRMEGEYQRGSVRFMDRVEAVDGPIARWEDELDVHAIRQLSLDQKLITCDVLQVQRVDDLSWNRASASNAPSPSLLEVEARDRVKVDGLATGGQYQLIASKVRYSGVHNILHIEGRNQQPAEILYYQGGNSLAPNRVVVRSADFDVAANEIRNAQISQIQVELNGSQGLGTSQPPTPTPGGNAIPDPRGLNSLRPR